MTKILVVDDEHKKYCDYLIPKFVEVKFIGVSDGKTAENYVSEVDIIISIGRWLTKELLIKARKLKWIQCSITGTEHLTQIMGNRSDVILTNGRGIHGPQMTEVTLLHMLSLYRQVRRLTKNQENHTWDRFLPMVLDKRVVAILGLGAIAEHMARCFKSLGMKVYGISRTHREIEGVDKVFLRKDLIKAAAVADFLVVLVPFGQDTNKIINLNIFEAMKPSAYLINVARGGVVNEQDLISALREGRIAGAGLDVFEDNPLPPDSPLWDMSNVFITPRAHIIKHNHLMPLLH